MFGLSLGRLGAGGSKPGASFALDFTGNYLDPRITFTRASTATYIGSNGVMQTAAINAPRFDYDPVTLLPLGLLIEEQRTNLLTYSEQFDDGTWAKANSTVSPNATIAPDGMMAADKFVPNNGSTSCWLTKTFSALPNTAYSLSVYLSGAGMATARVNMYCNETSDKFADFNLTTGAPSNVSAGITASSQFVGNGFWRCTITQTLPATITNFQVQSVRMPSGTGDGVSGLYVWGAQLEAGSFATSYIPTVASQVTRAADVAVVSNLAPWYNASEGSIAVEGDLLASTPINGPVIVDIGAGGAFGTTAYIATSSGAAYGLNPNAAPLNLSSSVNSTSPTFKAGAGLAPNNSVFALGGVLGSVDTSCAVPSNPTKMTIGAAGWAAGNYLNGHIKRIRYFPRRLTNAQIQAITT